MKTISAKIFSVLLISVGITAIAQTDDPASQFPSLEIMARREVHEFDLDLLRKIIRPDRNRGEDLIQYPFMPRLLLKKVMKAFDQSKSIAYQMQMKYGLNEYNVSYIHDDPSTFATVGDHRSGNSPNCFLCHSSFIGDRFVPGIGNTRLDLRAFFHDLLVRNPVQDITAIPDFLSKLPALYKNERGASENQSIRQQLKDFSNRSAMIVSVFKFVLDPRLQSASSGHSNPWSFAEYLFNWRDDDMNYYTDSSKGRGLHPKEVVLDPMPWWQMKYKKYINWDGIISKSPRVIIQASLSPGRDGEQIRAMDPLFTQIFEEIEKLDPPVFPKLSELDINAIARGEEAFNAKDSCAECHGVHSRNGQYYRDPDQFRQTYVDEIIPLDHINTDPVRLKTVDPDYLHQLQNSWLGHYGEDPRYQFRWDQKAGYQVPPLWGVWASAPYFHNGSVPTLKAVLFPEMRPRRWRVVVPQTRSTPYDYENVGLVVDDDPKENSKDTKVYDTTLNDGRSNKGHEKYFDKMSIDTRNDILEYLKTL